MQNNHTYIFELGTEELPFSESTEIINSFCENLSQKLLNEKISFSKIEQILTPRRIGVIINDLSIKQEDINIEKKGPSIDKSFDQNNNPTKALLGFMKSCDITNINDLQTLETKQGAWQIYRRIKKGENTRQLLPSIIQESISKTSIKKTMRWGENKFHFARPVHWILSVLDDAHLKIDMFNIKSDITTQGHRFLSRGKIIIESAGDYKNIMNKTSNVIFSFEERKNIILKKAKEIASNHNSELVLDGDILQTVTSLVEHPFLLTATFDKKFLKIPEECLVSSIIDHQKCIPLKKDNKIYNKFIIVSNIKSTKPSVVINGNEVVMRARLEDAKFLYEKDLSKPLVDFRKKLNSIVFQKDLGTMEDKTNRISLLSSYLSENKPVNKENVLTAANLCKADLSSNMVYEFPELQGVMGMYLALNDGMEKEIAIAIQEHYKPQHASDSTPTTLEGSIVSIADSIDTICGMFAINKTPTGDKDPYSLRRHAFSIIRISIENAFSFNLNECIEKSLVLNTKNDDKNLHTKVVSFFQERIKSYLISKESCVEEVNAVIFSKHESVYEIFQKLSALKKVSQLKEMKTLTEGFKRVKNIVGKNSNHLKSQQVNKCFMRNDFEINLYNSFHKTKKNIKKLKENHSYELIAQSLLEMSIPISNFFENVMVMDNNVDVRNNRLSLLKEIHELFLEFADISRL